jgi:hypothetical protein
MLMLSALLCVTAWLACAVQPLASVPVTVKVFAELTVVAAVFAPFDQAYVAAPLAVKVVEPPGQKVAEPEIETEAAGNSVTTALAVPVQPLASVPVTV